MDRADGLLEHWRKYVHGDLGRKELDRDALRQTVDDMLDQRKRPALEGDFVGWNALGASELFATGRRATARIVSIRDTGVTINEQPRAEITLRVEPEGEEPLLSAPDAS